MSYPSKKNDFLAIFFQYPTKQWRFKELQEAVHLPDNKISKWLAVLLEDKIIRKIERKKSFPYYIANYTFSEYKNRKKLYAQELLYQSGLLNYLSNL